MIPFFSRMFPSTNLQDLNLDWICRRIMELSKGIIAPWINAQNQHWMVYDTAAETFVDSGVSAAGEGTGPQGEPGKSPVIGTNGNWYTWDTTTQAYTDTGTPATGPTGPEGPEGPEGPIGDGIPADAVTALVDGKRSAAAVSVGQYVYVKDSTITGIGDGMYTASLAIPANTDINNTYLTAVSGGAVNNLRDEVNRYSITSVNAIEGTASFILLASVIKAFKWGVVLSSAMAPGNNIIATSASHASVTNWYHMAVVGRSSDNTTAYFGYVRISQTGEVTINPVQTIPAGSSVWITELYI